MNKREMTQAINKAWYSLAKVSESEGLNLNLYSKAMPSKAVAKIDYSEHVAVGEQS